MGFNSGLKGLKTECDMEKCKGKVVPVHFMKWE
jgi:hypothetical protein